MRCTRSARTYQGSLQEASVELLRIKGGAAATWLVATKCLQLELEQLEQQEHEEELELRQTRRDAAAAGEAAASALGAGADPALQAENESLRQQAAALQQDKGELQAELQRAVQRSKQGDAGAEQITRIAKDAAVLVGGMYELEMELTELLERVHR